MKKMTKMYIKDQWKQHYISFSIVLIVIFLAAALSSLMSVVIGKIVDFVGGNNGDGQNILLLSCLLIVVVLCKEGANYSREYLRVDLFSAGVSGGRTECLSYFDQIKQLYGILIKINQTKLWEKTILVVIKIMRK